MTGLDLHVDRAYCIGNITLDQPYRRVRPAAALRTNLPPPILAPQTPTISDGPRPYANTNLQVEGAGACRCIGT